MREERWIRGPRRERLYRIQHAHGRDLVYAVDGDFRGSARQKFTRDARGFIVSRGHHPDLLHEEEEEEEEDDDE